MYQASDRSGGQRYGAPVALALPGPDRPLHPAGCPGPALFRQERVGRDEEPFTCFKFRTMCQDADPNVHRLAIQRFAAGETLSDDPDAPYKLTNDDRITCIGAFLRRESG